MKFLLAQINPVVGDLEGNAEKILEELSKIYAFTVSYVSNNPNKNHKEDISIRSHLLKTLINDLDNPKILFNQSVSSQWAVESIKKCKRIYKLNNLDFVIGSDLIKDIFYLYLRLIDQEFYIDF